MTQNEDKVAPEQLDEQQQQAILEKFDREYSASYPKQQICGMVHSWLLLYSIPYFIYLLPLIHSPN